DRWGKHSKIRAPDKDDGVPQGVRSMWGAAPTVAVYRVQRAMPCANEALVTEGRILFAPPRAGVPHFSGFIFESLARQRLRAAEGAMGGGKHFKIRPPDKDDAFPRE